MKRLLPAIAILAFLLSASVADADYIDDEIARWRASLEKTRKEDPDPTVAGTTYRQAGASRSRIADLLANRLVSCAAFLDVIDGKGILPPQATRLGDDYILAAWRVLQKTTRSEGEIAQYLLALRELRNMLWKRQQKSALTAQEGSVERAFRATVILSEREVCSADGLVFGYMSRIRVF